MNLKVRFKGAGRAPSEGYEDTLDKALPEREAYLSNCSDIATSFPIITAPSEKIFRTMFGIEENQGSVLYPQERKLLQRVKPACGLIVETPIPNECLRFSIVMADTQIHAAIKKAPSSNNLHLDAMQIVYHGGVEDIPCSLQTVEPEYLIDLIKCFADTAQQLQQTPMPAKTEVNATFDTKVRLLLSRLPVSLALEAKKGSISAARGPQPRN